MSEEHEVHTTLMGEQEGDFMARATQTGRAKEDGSTADENPRLPPAEERQEPNQQRGPGHKARYGRVEAAVWPRELDEGRTAYSVTLQRSYQDRDGKWQRTSSLDEGDLLPAAKALDEAYTWIQKARQNTHNEH